MKANILIRHPAQRAAKAEREDAGSRVTRTQAGFPALWIPAFAGMTLFLCLSAAPLLAATPAPTPVIDEAFCQQLVKHVPDADVAYQPGVDVYGNAVVPADLEGSNAIKLPDEFSIPLTVDLMHFLKMDASALPASAMGRNDIPLGTLTLRGNDVFFNGQPLTDPQQDNLAVLCLKPR